MTTEESKNPKEVQSESNAAAQHVVEQAIIQINEMKNEVPANGSNDLTESVGDAGEQFKGLPMRELIANPLIAAAEAQEKLAAVTWQFYKRFAYDEEKMNADGTQATRILEFQLNRPVVENGQTKMMPQQVQAPFIGLVPIPSLLIDRIDVDFQMEVTDQVNTKDSLTTETTADISAKWFTVSTQISGKVSTSRENTRSTNQTAKYQVHVTASQQKQTEGLSKLMDIMASCMEPIPGKNA